MKFMLSLLITMLLLGCVHETETYEEWYTRTEGRPPPTTAPIGYVPNLSAYNEPVTAKHFQSEKSYLAYQTIPGTNLRDYTAPSEKIIEHSDGTIEVRPLIQGTNLIDASTPTTIIQPEE